MRCRALIICLFSFCANFSFSQENKRGIDSHATVFITKKACDCRAAIPINLTKLTACSYQNPPMGGGLQEIKSNKKSDQIFELEHNSTWYLLSSKIDGELIFEIIPIDSTNDYDFLLYSYTDSSFCDAILNKKVGPIRGNLSLPVNKSNGKTGLSSKANNNLTIKSIGSTYSKSLKVKEGEKYMLIVDNVTPNGKGYNIVFNCTNKITIEGKVTDESNHPLATQIILFDSNNKEVGKTITSDNGKYTLTAEIKEAVDYSLLFYNNIYMPVSEIINTNKVNTIKNSLEINESLIKLKVGQTYNFLYFPNVSVLLNIEGTAILGLAQILEKNPKMRIQIQGHAAKNELTKNQIEVSGGFKNDKTISEERANEIYERLLQKGIAKEQMEKIGFSSDKPFVAHPMNEEEKNKNKRVSIKILSM